MKNRILIMIGGGVILLFAVFSGCGGNPGEKEYSKALAAWSKNDLVRAQSQLEKAIRKLSGNEQKSVANNQLGIICWKLGKYDQAIESFSESCRLANDLSGANLNLGVALYHVGRLEEAKFELTKILNDTPGHSMARLYLGLVMMAEANWQVAARELDSGVRAEPNSPAGQNALALAELHQGRNSDLAVKRLMQLIAASPEYTPALYNLAVIHEQWLRSPDSALGWYKQYLQKAGDRGARAEAAKQAIERLSQPADSADRTVEKRSGPEAARRFIANGTALHAAGKYREAVVQYEKAIAADPTMVNAHYNLGLSYYELKQYRDAVRACSAALQLSPDYTNARYMLALSYARLGEWSNAEREAEALRQADKGLAEAVMKYIDEARN